MANTTHQEEEEETAAAAAAGGAHVLIIPYPAQGHMLPLLDLAALLSRRGLSVSIAVTPKNLPLLSPLLTSSPSIQPVLFPFPADDHYYPSLPSGVENTKDLPPSLTAFLLIMHALSLLHQPILSWARSIANPPVAVISDFFMGWTFDLARDLNVPRITFCPSGALALCITNYLWLNMPMPDVDGDVNFSVEFDSLPRSPVYQWGQLSTVYRSYKKEGDPLSEFIKDGFLNNIKSWGFVFNSFQGLESSYLDHMRRELGHDRVWAVGPLSLSVDWAAGRGGASSVAKGELLTWLDGRGEGSVVYVCFGSQAELTEKQAAAVAEGLERSGAHFVWSMRGGAHVDGDRGFEQRTKGRGLVIKGWAPQVEILGHAAVGAFVTHCGWNSVLEGIAAGVAMLTWPMGADQFYNARLLEEELGVGVRVCQGMGAVPDAGDLAGKLAAAVDGGGGEVAMRRAAELRRKAAAAVGEGGSSWRDVGDLVERFNEMKGGYTY